uniref:Uncharacterized protein n=1 Tax=Ditylenchus dipsaci TaxID=166011 RepID=A0A915DSU7_9BILA
METTGRRPMSNKLDDVTEQPKSDCEKLTENNNRMGLYIEGRQGREAAKAGFDFATQLMVLPTGLDRGKQFRGEGVLTAPSPKKKPAAG